MDNETRLPAVGHLPELVYFYKLINNVFAFRLTEKDSLAFSVPQAIEHLAKYENPEVIELLNQKWNSFKKTWSEVRDILAELVGCNDQMRNRQFESYILQLDDNTPIGYLLSHKDFDSYDEIVKVINELLKFHHEILDERNKLKDLSYLYESDDRLPIPLESLPYDIDNQYLLITGHARNEFEHYALSQVRLDDQLSRNQLSFDWDRIQRQVKNFKLKISS